MSRRIFTCPTLPSFSTTNDTNTFPVMLFSLASCGYLILLARYCERALKPPGNSGSSSTTRNTSSSTSSTSSFTSTFTKVSCALLALSSALIRPTSLMGCSSFSTTFRSVATISCSGGGGGGSSSGGVFSTSASISDSATRVFTSFTSLSYDLMLKATKARAKMTTKPISKYSPLRFSRSALGVFFASIVLIFNNLF